MTTPPAAPASPPAGATPLTPDVVRQALRKVKDPELDLNIIDLGLVYDVIIDDGDVQVNMTLTSPGCPAGPMITSDVYRAVRELAVGKGFHFEDLGELTLKGFDEPAHAYRVSAPS